MAIALLLMHATANVQAQEGPNDTCLKLGANVDLGNAYPIYEKVINAIYARAGMCATSIPVNPMRQSLLIASGGLDGEWLRYEGYDKIFEPDLMPVPQPIFQMEAVLVRRADSSFSGNPVDLEGRRVAHVNGLRWIETHLPLHGAIGVPVPGDVPAIGLLLRNRFDIYATHRLQAEEMLASLGEGQNSIIVSHWDNAPFLHFLHKRHADKLDRLATATLEAIAAGDMEEMYALPGIDRIELD